MTRRLQDWELDMILGGDATPEMEQRLAQSAPDQARLQELAREERLLFAALVPVAHPPVQALAEALLGLVDPATQQQLTEHLSHCDRCRAEQAQLRQLHDQPLFTRDPRAPTSLASRVRRIVLALEQSMGAAAPAVALRGTSQATSRYYSGAEFQLALTTEQAPQGVAVQGMLFAGMMAGHALLKQGEGAPYQSALTANTFTFEGVSPGTYDLVLDLDDTELIIPDLSLPA